MGNTGKARIGCARGVMRNGLMQTDKQRKQANCLHKWERGDSLPGGRYWERCVGCEFTRVAKGEEHGNNGQGV